jgi:hypothetical protein
MGLVVGALFSCHPRFRFLSFPRRRESIAHDKRKQKTIPTTENTEGTEERNRKYLEPRIHADKKAGSENDKAEKMEGRIGTRIARMQDRMPRIKEKEKEFSITGARRRMPRKAPHPLKSLDLIDQMYYFIYSNLSADEDDRRK